MWIFVHKWRSTIFPVCRFFVHNSRISFNGSIVIYLALIPRQVQAIMRITFTEKTKCWKSMVCWKTYTKNVLRRQQSSEILPRIYNGLQPISLFFFQMTQNFFPMKNWLIQMTLMGIPGPCILIMGMLSIILKILRWFWCLCYKRLRTNKFQLAIDKS